MKKLSVFILIMSLFGSGCNDLDNDVVNAQLTENFYKNERDLDVAIFGAYKDYTYHTLMNHYFFQFLMADDLSTRPGKPARIAVDGFNPMTDEGDAFYAKMWREYWQLIYNVNTFVEKSVNAEVSEKIKNQKTAQMRFLRGYAYMILTRNFGSVPLITSTDADGTEPRAKTTELYAFIEEDFKFAEAHLEGNWGADMGRPTKWAAKAGLTYLYMTWAGWPVKDNTKYSLALDAAKDIVMNGPFSLDVNKDGQENIADFADLWNPEESFDGNSESIFEFMFSNQEVVSGSAMFGSMLAQGMYPEDLVPGQYAGGWQDHNAEIGFYKRYPDTDPRKAITFLSEWPSTENNNQLVSYEHSRHGKPTYKKWTSSGQRRDFYNGLFRNFTLFRFADILLLQAEAENEVNGPNADAYAALNRVRKRAGVPDLQANLGKTEFATAVINERMLELAGEGPRYWDLQRRELLGVFNDPSLKDPKDFMPMKDPKSPANWTFPIPQQEIRLNPNLDQYFDAATMAK